MAELKIALTGIVICFVGLAFIIAGVVKLLISHLLTILAIIGAIAIIVTIAMVIWLWREDKGDVNIG